MASSTDDEAREKADRSSPREAAPRRPGVAAALPDAGSRALAAFRGFLARGRFSSLTRRIVASMSQRFSFFLVRHSLSQSVPGRPDRCAAAEPAHTSRNHRRCHRRGRDHVARRPADRSATAGAFWRRRPAPIPMRVSMPPRRSIPPPPRRSFAASCCPRERMPAFMARRVCSFPDSRQLTASGQIVAFEPPPPEGADERRIFHAPPRSGRLIFCRAAIRAASGRGRGSRMA